MNDPSSRKLPHLCFVGPMLGKVDGRIPSQGETLAEFLHADGFPVSLVSRNPNRWLRLADIAWTLIVHGRRTDVQMLQMFGGGSFPVEDMASLIGISTGQKIVMTLHGGGLPAFAARHPAWTRRVFARADVITAPSEYLARDLAWLGFPIRVIPNTIDLNAYPYEHRRRVRPRILWMRAFHEIYDPILAVRAFAGIRAVYPDAMLTMGGPDHGLLKATRDEARKLRVSSGVYFVGVLDEIAKVAEARRHDLYMVTNRIDNMPVSVIQMSAMGLPVVATRVGGIPDLCTDGVDSLLVDYGDAEALADAVIRLVETPALVSSISTEAYKLAQKSSWENVRMKWLALFHDLDPNVSLRSFQGAE